MAKNKGQSTTILSFFASKPTSLKKRPAVIVIDSDSEDSTSVPNKRRKTTPPSRESSPDIEFVEFVQHKPISEPTHDSYIPFGKPFSLLLDTTTNTPSVLPPALFGKPPVLLPSSENDSNLFPVNDTAPGTEHTLAEVIDEWGTADDELAQITFDDDDDLTSPNSIHCPPAEPTRSGDSEALPPQPKRLLRPLSSKFDPTTQPSPSPLPSEPHPSHRTNNTRSHTSDLYSVLMSSHKENEAWKEAEGSDLDRGFRLSKSNGGRRKAPFYKVLQGMPIAVDAFKYGTIPGISAYFLTHAHSDHYTALSHTWNSGPIYCSEGTANLIRHMLRVHPSWVRPLPMDVPTEIPDTGGVRVTLIEANHCPGSCLFLFEGKQTVNAGDSTFKSGYVGSERTFRYLHCGDFRASPAHVNHPMVRGKKIDHVYLDTTYLDPKYTFPPQPLVISACAELARRIEDNELPRSSDSAQAGTRGSMNMDAWVTAKKPNAVKEDWKGKQKERLKLKSDKTLMIVGTYSIGKERIVKAIARALHSKIYCDPRKAAILRCEADPELHALLTPDPFEAQVHIVPLAHVNLVKLKEYGERYKDRFRSVVGFRPTGWT
ncbi:DNA cross-link repair protein pso2/snm1 [Lentinula raphanica]|nr:DNA cross-link repair protein pso2/snm1 [Lentinula raphanica]